VASVAQALATDPAEQRTRQIVGVLVGAVPAGAVSVENMLDLLEGLPIDDRLVASGALTPPRVTIPMRLYSLSVG
jgi:hypothetical protein